jgi:hypothetical protein
MISFIENGQYGWMPKTIWVALVEELCSLLIHSHSDAFIILNPCFVVVGVGWHQLSLHHDILS